MKNFLLLKSLLTVLIVELFPTNMQALNAKVNGINYNFSESEATVTYNGGYSGGGIIPSSVTYKDKNYSVTSIESNAFSNCSGLTYVIIPNSVTSIGSSAFYGCSGLTSVTIPNSVTSIGSSAFSGCSGLISVTIPNSVTSIGSSAFEGCSGLTSVTIPNSVTSIGSSAFEGCSGLRYLSIPNSVTSIGNYALSGCSGLTSITIPNSVTSIGDCAFSGCSGLRYLSIPNSVTSIGNYALSGCSGLTTSVYNSTHFVYMPRSYGETYTIPDGIINICGGAFSNCINLTSVTISNSVTSIGSSAFADCSGLTSITIPNSVTSIGSSAFSGCSGLTSITIPNSVTSIGDRAFNGCNNLSDIFIEDGSLELSFNTTTDLSTNYFLDTPIENLYVGRPFTFPRASPFSNKGTLKRITLGDNMSALRYGSFSGCNNLSTVVSKMNTPFNLNTNAFSSSANITLYVPVGTKETYTTNGWTNSVFKGGVCTQLEELKFMSPTEVLEYGRNTTLQLNPIASPIDSERTLIWSSSDEDIATVSNTGLVTGKRYGTVTITCQGLGSDGNTISASCRVIVYKEGLVYVGNIFYILSGNQAYVTNCASGFPEDDKERCEYSGTINIPESVTYDGVKYSVTAVGDYAFYNQRDLQAVVVPTSVSVLKYRSFENSRNLARVAFMRDNSCLETVSERAFYGCSKLDNVTLPNSVKQISESAFQYCVSLKKITLPSSIQSINKNVFANNSSLNDVVLPNSVQRIDHSAFRNCTSLSNITLSSSLNYINEYAFADCPSLNNLVLPESLKSIQIAAFNNDVALSSIAFPAGLEGIGAAAFANCTALTEVMFNTNNYTMTIGEDAFMGCNSIIKVKVAHMDCWVSINFSNSAANPASISHHIYTTDDMEIIDAVVPEGPIYLNNNVFYGCSNLRSIQLPSSVLFLNDNIFYECSSLRSVTSLADVPPMFIGVRNPEEMNDVFNATDLFVPAPSVNSYASDDWWKRFKQVLTFSNNQTTFIAGDANDDGSVNVFDVTATVNYILGSSSGGFDSDAADVNGDGTVNVFDVTKMVNIILGVDDAGAKMRKAEGLSATDKLYLEDFEIEPGEKKEVNILLDNPNAEYRDLQFDLYLPEGISVVQDEDDEFLVDTGSRCTRKHTVGFSYKDGHYVCMLYSTAKNPLTGNSGDILTITLKADEGVTPEAKTGSFRNVSLSKTDATGPTYDEFSFGINVKGDADGIEDVIANNGTYQIYTVDGQSVNTLQKGVNIIRYPNGTTKKVYVK